MGSSFNSTVNFNGQVSNNVGNVYIIKADGTGDLPTIQAGIDLVSSGLTPNPAPGAPPSNGGNVTLNIQPGTYVETLFVQATGCSDAQINDQIAILAH